MLLLSACGRFSSDGGSPSPESGVDPVLGGAAFHPSVGLASVVPAETSLLVEWSARGIEGNPQIALFLSEDRDTLFDSLAGRFPLEAGRHRFDSLAASTEYFVGLGVSSSRGGFEPTGAVLRARTGSPIYADAAADPGIADGTTPATAFADPFRAMLTAFAQGGGNVWLAGEFPGVSLGIFADVHLYGGFPRGFDLDQRDRAAHPTILAGEPNNSIVTLDGGGPVRVLDGLVLDGLGSSTNGVDVDGSDVELRGLTVRRCGRGARLRNLDADPVSDVELTDCEFSGHALEGLSLDGPFDLTFDGCRFLGNGQEGVDIGDLVAPSGERASLIVRDSRFAGNGAEGLDLDLDLPVPLGTRGGHFRVRIEDSDFEQNATGGLLVDIDYEASPLWDAEIEVRGSRARANRIFGIKLDLDGQATALIHRTLASANTGDGIVISSESRSGTATVASSALLGNLGVGLRTTLGNFGAVVSHCVVAGNEQGGVLADAAPAAVVSTVAHLQPSPWSGAELFGEVVTALDARSVFENAPASYLRATGFDGTALSVTPQPDFGIGALCELLDDAEPRRALTIGAGTLVLEPVPEAFPPPALVTFFSAGDSVDEDLRPVAGSPIVGAGLGLPSGPVVDCGPFGTPAGGAPGFEDLDTPAPFAVGDSNPSWTLPIPTDADLEVSFAGGAPDPATVPASVFAVDAGGDVLSSVPFVQGELVVVPAPPGGWESGMRVELHPQLLSVDGRPLTTTVVLPLRVR